MTDEKYKRGEDIKIEVKRLHQDLKSLTMFNIEKVSTVEMRAPQVPSGADYLWLRHTPVICLRLFKASVMSNLSARIEELHKEFEAL